MEQIFPVSRGKGSCLVFEGPQSQRKVVFVSCQGYLVFGLMAVRSRDQYQHRVNGPSQSGRVRAPEAGGQLEILLKVSLLIFEGLQDQRKIVFVSCQGYLVFRLMAA